MLALKLVLAGGSSVPTLIFDEVDSGRRRRRGRGRPSACNASDKAQILVVTTRRRSRRAARILASPSGRRARDGDPVEELDADTRQEEIARMLSGSTVTAEARRRGEPHTGARP